MSAAETAIAGVTAVSLPELITLRARARRPGTAALRTRAARSGQHVSALRGRGMDYAESRIYQPGDDARNIDWRRTARSGKLYTKLFEEDRERGLVILMDTHAGMRFGTRVRYKSVTAARAAAVAAWSAVAAGEPVGALAFGSVRAWLRPQAGTRGALRVLSAITQWDARSAAHAGDLDAQGQPGQPGISVTPVPASVHLDFRNRNLDPGLHRDDEQTVGSSGSRDEPLAHALSRAQRLVALGSRVLLISDGWSCDREAGHGLTELARRRDVRVLIVVDALEYEPPPVGAYAFETGGGRVALDLHAASARGAFTGALGAGRQRLADLAARAGVRAEMLDARSEPESALARLWSRARGRR